MNCLCSEEEIDLAEQDPNWLKNEERQGLYTVYGWVTIWALDSLDKRRSRVYRTIDCNPKSPQPRLVLFWYYSSWKNQSRLLGMLPKPNNSESIVVPFELNKFVSNFNYANITMIKK